MQHEIAATARRYDMAVSGPNTRGLCQYRGRAVPELQPGHGQERRAAPAQRGRSATAKCR